MRLNLDLDGVLVDFVRGALAIHGRPDFPFESIAWDFNRQLGIPEAEFYAPMGHDFWADLPWTPEGQEFLAALTRSIPRSDIRLLTACVATPGCASGKMSWIAKHLPDFYEREAFDIRKDKDFYARPDAVLVDDNEKNLDAFRAAGGRVVRVPRPWNAVPNPSFSPTRLARKVIEEYYR